MKNQFILSLLLLLFGLSGCSVFRPGSTSTDPSAGSGYTAGSSGKTSEVKFIRNISTGDSYSANNYRTAETRPARSVSIPSSSKTARIENADKFNSLRFKYAILTNTPVEMLTNQKLLDFMDDWYGVPYAYGGTNKHGIDCSAFASQLMSDVYRLNDLPRISRDQYKESRRIPKADLREGDLVFFHTLGRGHSVTHVGVYLYNNRFIHASVSGVQISDLTSSYYASHFVGAGRVIPDED